MRVLIGVGRLTWRRGERVSDRYGTVFLMPSGDSMYPPKATLPLIRTAGKGKLVAEVTETRQSTHIGDLFHGYFPVTPKVGEEIELGEGELFYEDDPEVGDQVGLLPDDEDGHWLNPPALYRAHEQTVKLYFEEGEQ